MVHNSAKTHCVHGHAYTPENTYIVPSSGARACRECRRTRNRAESRRNWPKWDAKRTEQRHVEWRRRVDVLYSEPIEGEGPAC